ncbi:MAG: endonuclease/exonuclease/phosphatase family protein, partial [Actinomycetota bacterium]
MDCQAGSVRRPRAFDRQGPTSRNYGLVVLIATWNVNSLKARLPRVQAWISDVQPDVLLMQETKMTDKAFPAL